MEANIYGWLMVGEEVFVCFKFSGVIDFWYVLPGAYLLLFGASFTLEGDLGTARPFGIP